MVVGGDTFAHDLLVLLRRARTRSRTSDATPLPARRARARSRRPQPEVILLPTEPYAFGERDRDELLALDCPAARNGRVHVVEGELLSWYGPRMPRALATFARAATSRCA